MRAEIKRTKSQAGWLAVLGLILAQLLACTGASRPAAADTLGKAVADAQALYQQEGADPTFEALLEQKAFPIGENSTAGVLGAKIKVNHALLAQSVGSANPVPEEIKIHTLCNSVIPRKDFPKWTRWYQEDGGTQIFRLFKGEHNVRNTRADAARVEAFSELGWGRGDWHEWEGTYTIVKPHGCSIFQAKNNISAWGIMVNLNDQGDIIINHRRFQKDLTVARNMTGKSFHLKVRDNGHDYEVYFNDNKVAAGHYERPEGKTAFRWGMYLGANPVKHDAMIFVTGARFK